jgi:hypothetical protein
MQKYQDLKWQKINPEMGSKSAEIAVLHVNPTTQATEMLIRTPKDTMCQSIGIAPMRQLLLYMASSS